jgi:iron complex transport system substrate-binding protein
LLSGACGSDRGVAAPVDRQAGFEITDDQGRRVRFSEAARRIVSLAPSHTEALYALGAGDRVIGADTYSDYPPSAKSKARLTCWPQPPIEQIVALKPDLVVFFTEGDEVRARLDAARLRTLKLFPASIEGAYQTLLRLGKATGAGARAEQLVAAMRARVLRVRKKVTGAAAPRALFELDASDPSRPFVAGGAGLYGEILQLAGAKNIFGDANKPALSVSTEEIVARDPQVLLLGDTRSPVSPQNPAKIRARPGWAGVSAVRDGRVYAIQGERLTRATPRLVDGLEEVARRIHPDRFR